MVPKTNMLWWTRRGHGPLGVRVGMYDTSIGALPSKETTQSSPASGEIETRLWGVKNEVWEMREG